MGPISFSGTVLSKIPTYFKYYSKKHVDNCKKSIFIPIVFMILIQTKLKLQNSMTSEIECIICLHYAILPL